jgi:hypothetical protein
MGYGYLVHMSTGLMASIGVKKIPRMASERPYNRDTLMEEAKIAYVLKYPEGDTPWA